MANSLYTNPVIITGTMAASYKTLTASVLGAFQTLRISKLYWVGATAAGHTVTIESVSGAVLYQLEAGAADYPVELDFEARPELVADFQVTQISSGTLYIYLD